MSRRNNKSKGSSRSPAPPKDPESFPDTVDLIIGTVRNDEYMTTPDNFKEDLVKLIASISKQVKARKLDFSTAGIVVRYFYYRVLATVGDPFAAIQASEALGEMELETLSQEIQVGPKGTYDEHKLAAMLRYVYKKVYKAFDRQGDFADAVISESSEVYRAGLTPYASWFYIQDAVGVGAEEFDNFDYFADHFAWIMGRSDRPGFEWEEFSSGKKMWELIDSKLPDADDEDDVDSAAGVGDGSVPLPSEDGGSLSDDDLGDEDAEFSDDDF